MAKHTIQELKMRQALPLEAKISMTKLRIREWVNEFGTDGVYVSFSGGKDSTVLLHLVREIYPDVPAVFVDTGLEYPEIREFVKTFDNVEWLKPKMNFKQVIQKYGYPFISKEVSECVSGARKYLSELITDGMIITDRQTDRQTDSTSTSINITNYADLVHTLVKRMRNREGGSNERLLMLLGAFPQQQTTMENIPDKSIFNQVKYKFLLEAPFEISNKCCNVMKKAPAHKYSKETGRVPILATMTEESRLRTQKWLQNGCNGFEMKSPVSTPMSFWTEQDVLKYIKDNNIRICSLYGEIIPDYSNTEEMEGQMDFADLGLINDNRKLKTTGCNRTGCMFCGYGCHLEKSPNRFERMKETHPKQYEYIMKPVEKGGLGYKEVIDWINEHGNMNIKY